jgi:hypothetical protein
MRKTGRPKGYRLNLAAFEDLLDIRCISKTEAAKRSDLKLTTVSSLSTKTGERHRASIDTARKLAAGLDVQPATLFPELAFTDLRDEDAEVAA